MKFPQNKTKLVNKGTFDENRKNSVNSSYLK